jgi:hypothetical protein
MIAISIMSIADPTLVWLRYVLLTLNVALYVFIVASTSYKDGQNALKTRVANDLERMRIIQTGDALPLKLKEEYKPWKGFLFGGIACAPLIVLLFVHTLLILFVGPSATGAGVIASFIYMMIFAFSRAHIPVVENAPIVVDPYIYYWALLAIPVIMLTVGISYILGAKKIERQQEMIKAKHRSIYGE